MNKSVIKVVNPYDLRPVGEVDVCQWEDIDFYLNEAQKLHLDYSRKLPAFKRIEILAKAAEIMRQKSEHLALQIANEGGKPLVDARIEVARAIDGMGLCIKAISHIGGRQIPMDLTEAGSGRIAFSMREPIGVVVAISAFNHPLNLIVHQVAPAIATGCPVLVKPAANTPLSCRDFVNILYQAGLDPEWCRFVMCDTSLAEKMITDSRVNFFSFIGSGKIGWMLRSKLAPGTRCALEHGGAAPVIVDETAKIEDLVKPLIKGGFYHSGQVCISVQRVFVPRNKAASIADALAEKAKKLVVGNAIDEKTECGPLIRPSEVERVAQWVVEADEEGAKILCGGKKLTDTTYAPTILLDPSNESKVSKQEIFAPVICVYSYDTIDEAIKRANSLPYAFQASVFTKKLDIATKCIQRLDASAVMVNDHSAFRVDWMPFAGRRQSGYGVGGIEYTMHDMTQEKMAVIKL